MHSDADASSFVSSSGPDTVRRIPPAANPPASAEVDPTALERRLAAIQARFDDLQAQVRQAQQLANLGTAAAMLAHEVNNLLTPVLSYAQAGLESHDPALREKALQTTVKHVQMLVNMAQRILKISAARTTSPETVGLGHVVHEAILSLGRDLGKDDIRLIVEVEESIQVYVDPIQLQQVLFNLLLNAREAMTPGGGKLRIEACRREGKAELRLTNSGRPIPPELLPHIFDPLQTTQSTGKEGQARCRGLGLALCRDLIESNGGSIEVSSSRERGTTFTLRLPLPPDEVGSQRTRRR
ncbi:MAG: hypothetical protein D6788_01760 [Planctomycetota bacterium]|nr:MAG: hypothetical protein D6788_01760 [Planctomycetota bacterium]